MKALCTIVLIISWLGIVGMIGLSAWLKIRLIIRHDSPFFLFL